MKLAGIAVTLPSLTPKVDPGAAPKAGAGAAAAAPKLGVDAAAPKPGCNREMSKIKY